MSESVTLAALHAANKARQTEWCEGGAPEPDLAFRGNELAGETGEACNVIKKLERERHGWRGSRATPDQLAEELADVVICADLCAVTAGIDLGAAVVAKFNATSEKVGLTTRLEPAALASTATWAAGGPPWGDRELEADPRKLIAHLQQQCRDFIRERDDWKAAALASTAGAGAGNWVLVPREPTPEMQRAYEHAYWRKADDVASPTPTEFHEDGGGPFGYGYSAMIKAAPTPTPAARLAEEWASVPKVPTDEMLFVGMDRALSFFRGDLQDAISVEHAVYRAMIEAAPAVPASPRSGAGEIAKQLRSRLEEEAWSQASVVSCYWIQSRPDRDLVEVVNRDLRLLYEATHEVVSPPAPAEHGVEIRDAALNLADTIRSMVGRAIDEDGRMCDAQDPLDDLCDAIVDQVLQTFAAIASTPKAGTGDDLAEVVEWLKHACPIPAYWRRVQAVSALSQRGAAGRSERAVEIRELSEKAMQGPWAYRPDRYDDWGFIRAPRNTPDMPGEVVAVSRGEGSDTHDAHRTAGTDPYEPNGRFIAALVNAWRSGELVHRSEIAGRSEKGEGEEGRVPSGPDYSAQPAPAQSPSTSDAEG